MTPITLEEFEKQQDLKFFRNGKYQLELRSFLDSKAKAAELNNFGNPYASSGAHRVAAQRNNFPVRIICRQGRVFAMYDESATQVAPIRNWQKELAWEVIGSDFGPPPDICETVENILSELNERERNILLWRFRDRLTLEQTGEKFGITRERVRQIQEKTTRILRNPRFRDKLILGISAF